MRIPSPPRKPTSWDRAREHRFTLLRGESAALGSLAFDLGLAAERQDVVACAEILGFIRAKLNDVMEFVH